jgi:hypothetical protein
MGYIRWKTVLQPKHIAPPSRATMIGQVETVSSKVTSPDGFAGREEH